MYFTICPAEKYYYKNIYFRAFQTVTPVIFRRVENMVDFYEQYRGTKNSRLSTSYNKASHSQQ